MSRIAVISRTPLALLALFCFLPAFQTLVSVSWLWHTRITYPTLKVMMILIPILVWRRMNLAGETLRDRVGWKRTSTIPGLCVGMLMAGVIIVGYYAALRPMINPGPVLARLRSLGALQHYWIMALVLSLGNSLFEEYYWRAFIISELGGWLKRGPVLCVVGGILFGIHHIFALLSVFNWQLVVLCATGTIMAGGVWSWMRLRGNSILDCYISHVLADLAIMWVGHDVIVRAS